MDKFFAYLLLILIIFATWNDSLSNRLRRIVGGEAVALRSGARTGTEAPEAASEFTETSFSAAPAPAPQATPQRTPFWQAPGYRNVLEQKKDKK